MFSDEKVQDLPSFEALAGVLLFPSEGLSPCVQEMQSCPAENSQGWAKKTGQVIGLCIEGVPVPKQRARHMRRGNFIATYDPQEKQKIAFRKALTQELFHSKIELEASNPRLETFFSIDLSFYLPTPVSSTNARKNANLWHIYYHMQKPDIDNLVKFVLDCANGILYFDDSQIIELSAKKYYSDNPRTEIKLHIMEKIGLHETAEKIITIFEPKELLALMQDMRFMADLSKEFQNSLSKSQQAYFFSLVADRLAHFMRTHGGHLAKVKKHQEYQLSNEQFRQCKEALYGDDA